jgi:hypothetical protein
VSRVSGIYDRCDHLGDESVIFASDFGYERVRDEHYRPVGSWLLVISRVLLAIMICSLIFLVPPSFEGDLAPGGGACVAVGNGGQGSDEARDK